MKFRYFITDNSNKGSLIIGKLNPNEMLLILGKTCVEQTNISEICSWFAEKFHFSVEVENLDFVTLNTDDRFPYTYYNLLVERTATDKTGYFYANVSDIQDYFSDKECISMLRSINSDIFD
jgi:hypothetical protein